MTCAAHVKDGCSVRYWLSQHGLWFLKQLIVTGAYISCKAHKAGSKDIHVKWKEDTCAWKW